LYKEELDPYNDIRNYDFPDGFGSAFILFKNTGDCIRARKAIHLMKYNKSQVVECVFLTEKKFQDDNFSV
jgi:hypothetical protein